MLMPLTSQKYTRPLDASFVTGLNSFLRRKPKETQSHGDLRGTNQNRHSPIALDLFTSSSKVTQVPTIPSRMSLQLDAPVTRHPRQTTSPQKLRPFNEKNPFYLNCDVSKSCALHSSLSLIYRDADAHKEYSLANSKGIKNLFYFHNSNDSFDCLATPSFRGSVEFFDCDENTHFDDSSPSKHPSASHESSSLQVKCISDCRSTDESFQCRGLSSSQMTPKSSHHTSSLPAVNCSLESLGLIDEPCSPASDRDWSVSPSSSHTEEDDGIQDYPQDPIGKRFHESLEDLKVNSMPVIEEENSTSPRRNLSTGRSTPSAKGSQPNHYHGIFKCVYLRRVVSKTKSFYVKFIFNTKNDSSSTNHQRN